MRTTHSGRACTGLILLAGAAVLVSCTARPADDTDSAAASSPPPATPPIADRDGFSGPEAVRYDPDQDIYFVANFNGGGMDSDNNGFISRLGPDGTVQALKFIAGGVNGVTLHAPRGMAISGDTLWAADVEAVRGFDRHSGAAVATISFSGEKVGFLNDVAVGPEGALYITDTGTNRIYRIAGRALSVAADDRKLGDPNGITWDSANARFIVVPYGGRQHAIRAWKPGGAIEEIGTSAGGSFDGVEVLPGGRVLVASQADSSLHLFAAGAGRPIIRMPGAPADIGVDTKRNRVAVPFIGLHRVVIWALPER